jgi:hypothetical protein
MFSMYFADFVHCEAVIEISLQRMKFKEWLGFGDTVVKSYDKVIWYCFRRLTIHSVDHIRQVIVVLTFMNSHSSYYCETYNNFILRTTVLTFLTVTLAKIILYQATDFWTYNSYLPKRDQGQFNTPSLSIRWPTSRTLRLLHAHCR